MRQTWSVALAATALLALAAPAFAQQPETVPPPSTDTWPMAARGPSTRVGDDAVDPRRVMAPAEPMERTSTAADSEWPMAARGPSTRVGSDLAPLSGRAPSVTSRPLPQPGAKRATSASSSVRRAGTPAPQRRTRRHRKLHKH